MARTSVVATYEADIQPGVLASRVIKHVSFSMPCRKDDMHGTTLQAGSSSSHANSLRKRSDGGLTAHQIGMTQDSLKHHTISEAIPQSSFPPEYQGTDIIEPAAATPTRSSRLSGSGGGGGAATTSKAHRASGSSGSTGVVGGSGGSGGMAVAAGFGSGLLAGATSMLTKVATHVSGADVEVPAAGEGASSAVLKSRAQVDQLKAQVLSFTQENDALTSQVGRDARGGSSQVC